MYLLRNWSDQPFILGYPDQLEVMLASRPLRPRPNRLLVYPIAKYDPNPSPGSPAVVDNFNRGSLTGWTSPYISGAANLQITSNRLVGSTSTTSDGVLNGNVGADIAVALTFNALPTGGDSAGPMLRMAGGSSGNGYWVGWNTSGWFIARIDAGASFPTLGSFGTTVPFNAGDKLGAVIVGSRISVWRYDTSGSAWQFVGSVTDSTYSNNGLVGLRGRGTVFAADDLQIGPASLSSPFSSAIASSLGPSPPAVLAGVLLPDQSTPSIVLAPRRARRRTTTFRVPYIATAAVFTPRPPRLIWRTRARPRRTTRRLSRPAVVAAPVIVRTLADAAISSSSFTTLPVIGGTVVIGSTLTVTAGTIGFASDTIYAAVTRATTIDEGGLPPEPPDVPPTITIVSTLPPPVKTRA